MTFSGGAPLNKGCFVSQRSHLLQELLVLVYLISTCRRGRTREEEVLEEVLEVVVVEDGESPASNQL